jgi:hypothetical protein
MHAWQVAKGLDDQGMRVLPVETAVAAPERRDGDGPDATVADYPAQVS